MTARGTSPKAQADTELSGARREIAGNNNTAPTSTSSRPTKQVLRAEGTLRLNIGNRATGIAVHPDPQWPGMWRVHHRGPGHHDDHRGAHGHHDYASDILSLTRAKDAAIS